MTEQKSRPLEPTPAASWRRVPPGESEILELPSGNFVRARQPMMTKFVELGMIPNSLLTEVDAAISKHTAPSVEGILENEQQLQDVAKFMDDVFMYCVVDPAVQPVPRDLDGEIIPQEERSVEILYIDQIELEDKTFMFQYAVGGTRSLTRFREERVADVAAMASSSGPWLKAQPPLGPDNA